MSPLLIIQEICTIMGEDSDILKLGDVVDGRLVAKKVDIDDIQQEKYDETYLVAFSIFLQAACMGNIEIYAAVELQACKDLHKVNSKVGKTLLRVFSTMLPPS